MGGLEKMKNSDQTSQLIFKPLMISMVGIAFTALAIVIYQFIITKYCMRRRAAAMLQRIERSQISRESGVDEKVLKSIPIITYSNKQDQEGVFCVDQSECSVCLGDLEEGEMLRLLPKCRHVFHMGCIDQWWLSHSTCPICRSPVVEQISVSLQMEGGLLLDDDHGEENHIVHQAAGRRQGIISAEANSGGNNNNSLMVGSKLRHCVSLIWPNDERKQQQSLPVRLKRSLSMDCSNYVCIKIQSNHVNDSSSSSSPSSSSPQF